MSGDEEILYGYIQEAAREGIWTKTLKAKTNMHTTTMNKALKGLEGKRFVKAIKSVKVSSSFIYPGLTPYAWHLYFTLSHSVRM